MPKINVNLTNVEGGFGIYPDGIFLVEIQESSKVKRSSNGAYIMWIGKILEGPNNIDVDVEGKLISWNTSLQEQALWNLKDLLEKLGLTWDEDGFELDDAHGLEVYIHNTSGEVYNGQPTNSVDAYYSAKDIENMEQGEK